MPGDDRAESLADYSAAPRLELDQLLTQLIDRAQDVVAARDRLRGLLRANRLIIGDLALPVVLRRIAEAARDLVQARYAALGVLGPDGGLEQFIHVGVDDETVARIGHLPEGKGLLGALIDDPRPIRLANLADDPRSVGFPEGHPAMSCFLGVPIRIRDEVYGNLYLTEREGGPFTAEDEELVAALAATAASAIDNARLYAEAGRRQRWLEASTEITRQLLSSEGEPPLSVIARRLHEMADADVVAVVLPTADPQRLMVEVATGEQAAQLTALSYPVEDTIAGVAINTGRPVLVGDVTQQQSYLVHLAQLTPVGPMMALPLLGTQGSRGAVLVARVPGRHRFNEADLDIATTFAQHAAVALELADARADQQRMMLLEDRDRIARDLHDHVIQRLFAAGLGVQSVAASAGSDSGASRLNTIVDDLDETIRQVRTTIFELRGPLTPQPSTVRSQVVDVIDEVVPMLGFSPALRFTGPVDTVVPDEVAGDLIAVVREALSNIARHAHASAAAVEVTATPAQLTVDVTDNGVGIGESKRRSGLANLARRAERYGGSLTLPDHEGTQLRWTIPLK
ncbi:MAG TPA: GAF domain-containing protein [Jatrophihabitantaceae bacterium]|nr:GAF domain-containing protein [Jatrophihabitantaceae bacterium]